MTKSRGLRFVRSRPTPATGYQFPNPVKIHPWTPDLPIRELPRRPLPRPRNRNFGPLPGDLITLPSGRQLHTVAVKPFLGRSDIAFTTPGRMARGGPPMLCLMADLYLEQVLPPMTWRLYGPPFDFYEWIVYDIRILKKGKPMTLTPEQDEWRQPPANDFTKKGIGAGSKAGRPRNYVRLVKSINTALVEGTAAIKTLAALKDAGSTDYDDYADPLTSLSNALDQVEGQGRFLYREWLHLREGDIEALRECVPLYEAGHPVLVTAYNSYLSHYQSLRERFPKVL